MSALPNPGDRRPLLASLAAVVLLALVASGLQPYDRLTWFMEVAPVLIAAPLLALTWRRHPLSTVLLCVIAFHCLVLILGGHYTYARVPLGDWVREALHLSRNPYDKLGHFMQGVTPALLAREIFLRTGAVRGRVWPAFLAGCVALAFSAVYELIEWQAALALGRGADEFLGTQGDPWDTQSDMAMALIGATIALLVVPRAAQLRPPWPGQEQR
jgi:putative membrane protein